MKLLSRARRGSVDCARPSGFALIATLLLLILLLVLAVGIQSVSAISLRSAKQSDAMLEAKANAHMALMMAIGELQRLAGPDTRVTAPANLVDETYPSLLGVWRSWEGTNHDTTHGRPIAPDYAVKSQAESSGGRFVDWLVSSAASKATPSMGDATGLVLTTASADTVPLLAEGSLAATDTRQVHVVPTELENGGRIAWWISGENQKARLAQPYEPRVNDVTGLAEMGQSHTITDPSAFGLPALLEDREPFQVSNQNAKPGRRAASRKTMALLQAENPVIPDRKFHDFTTYANGLLTNVATGGWKKDLSILTERWDAVYSSYPGGKLPLFRYLPSSAASATSQVPKPVKPAPSVLVTNLTALAAATPAQSNLYPWSGYSTIIGTTAPNTYHAASASWQSLVSYATSYKNFSESAGGVKSSLVWDKVASPSSNLGVDKIYNYRHRQLIHPQIARFQFLVYARAVETNPVQNPKRYNIHLMYVPLFTLWNPYNVTLEHTISGTLNAFQGSGKHPNFLGFGWRRSPPGLMAIVNKTAYPNPANVPNTQFRLWTPGNFQTLDRSGNNVNPYDTGLASNIAKGYTQRWVEKRTFGCWLPEGTLSFKPGEAKIFSPEWSDPAYGLSGVLRLREGYNPSSIVGSEFVAVSNQTINQNFWFLMKTDRATQPFLNRIPGYGFSLSFGDGSSHFGANSTMPTGPGDDFHNLTALASESQGNAYWPPKEVAEIGYSVGELASGPWIPIASISFGPRITLGTGQGTAQNRPTKGVVQNNALAAMVLSDPGSGATKDHPVNNTFDFAYHSLSFGSTITPNVTNSLSYIATGYQSGDGLSRLIMCEIPLRPMASLVELQGWNPRGNNPYPPFQMNLIGNSDASPLIPGKQIVPSVLSPNSITTNLMHDDAYCANHLLFDDWFLSSIAPEPRSFGQSIARDISTVYRDFLKGEKALVNRAYKPITADSRLKDADATTRIAQIITSNDGWLKVASRLEVEGMFNVNSTSAEAWKALLGHAKSLEQIAMHGANGVVSTDVADKHVVTRGPIASDIEAGSGAGFGGQFANASEYAGFRSLSDGQIKDLAEKIVEQVRLRGPFLSLSEFVNRQLSDDGDLALAGAVQTAINRLSEDPMEQLRDPANSLASNTMSPNDAKLSGVGYEFPKAAEGSSAHGVPGWIRQADILRPLAPVLTVRDDTFTIRTYGDARNREGQVIAKAWCEAVVKRTREFIDPADAADSANPPLNRLNIKYGRRFEIISFRWLNANEV